jgi:hypothetical protein
MLILIICKAFPMNIQISSVMDFGQLFKGLIR